MYVITAATGHIGRALALELLAKKQKVRVVGRRADRLQPLVQQGAEAFVGNVEETGAMTRAFSGAKAVFTLIPPHYSTDNLRAYQNKVSESYASAITAASAKYVINLSSVGAHLAEKAGPVNGLHDGEKRFNKLEGVNIIHLRPCFFMENVLLGLDMIKNQGLYGTALQPDLRLAMISTRDIAHVAADLFLHLDFSGKSVRELLGQRELSMKEATQIIGRAIAQPDLKYVQLAYADTEKALVGMGLSRDLARLFVEMYRSTNEGIFRPTEARTSWNTTPTSFEDFAREVLVPAYQSLAVTSP